VGNEPLIHLNQLPRGARVYVATVIIAAMLVFAACVPQATFHQPLLFAALLVLSPIAAAMKVYLPIATGGSTLSLSYAVDFTSLLLLGPHDAMFVAIGSAVSQCHLNIRRGNPWHQTLFSAASLVITVQGAGFVYRRIAGTSALVPMPALLTPLLAAATVYFLLNTVLVACAIAFATRESAWRTWHNNFLWGAPGYFIGAGTAAIAAFLVQRAGYWLAPLGFIPLYLTYRTYKVYLGRVEAEQRQVKQTSDLHLATIEALARAIDAKDAMTQMHIRRVQVYAVGLARAVGLSEPAIQAIKTAALLHDIGKLAVPEHILSKPGPLTREEFQKIRIHPQVGAEIISGVPFPYPVAPLILSHHERWDGRGYPQGLEANEIPIGARILTVVDYYDAVTTERPYHRALNPDSAISLLRHEAGRALDPNLVPLFVSLLPSLAEEIAGVNAQLHSPPPARPIGVGHSNPSANRALEDIALAHREIYALYEIAQAMGTSLAVGDTMALISSKLTKLVPWSGCALFLYQPETCTLKCRYASGVDVPRLLNTTIDGSAGFGWSENNHLLMNVDPRAIFVAAGVPDETVLHSAIVCPLHNNDTFIGCLALYHVKPDHYREDHRRLLERIAEQAGPVINNAIVFEQTHVDSLTDPLTGLPNRRSLFAHLSRELARAERTSAEVAIIVMDIDGFKPINDTYGHGVGDRALSEVAAALQSGLRPYDLCVRYAGDEFVIVLAECSRDGAEEKQRELQSRIEEIVLATPDGHRVRIAASAGAAVYPHDGATCEALLSEADQRMYREKAQRQHLAADDEAALAGSTVVDIAVHRERALSAERRALGSSDKIGV